MKKNDFLRTAMMIVAMFTLFVSCKKEKQEEKKEDPAGAIEAFVRNDDRWSFATISLGRYNYTTTYYQSNFHENEPLEVGLDIDGSNNFFLRYDGGQGDEMKEKFIACVGKVSGLGYIETVPSSGWSARLAVQPGYGYVIRYRGSENLRPYYTLDSSLERYARFYVIEWMTSTYGGIIGAKVRFESEWTPSKL